MSCELVRSLLRVLAAALFLLLSSAPALAALSYQLTLDSSALAGQQGFLDIQLIPGESLGTPSATATLSDFVISGGASAVVLIVRAGSRLLLRKAERKLATQAQLILVRGAM
jgi:hypothetical protein